MDIFTKVPWWLLRPLPANAVVNEKLHAAIDKLAKDLPESIDEIEMELETVESSSEYDATANLACAHVWLALERFYASDDDSLVGSLLSFAKKHMPEKGQARVYRRLAKHRSTGVRRRARTLVEGGSVREVALPARPDGDWDSTGWLRGNAPGPLNRFARGRRVLARFGLPPVSNMAALRALLGIKSPSQLGWFLLASDKDNGPYTKFTVPKRSGGQREICAPKGQLRWVQRQLLEKILARVPAHDAAHGFVPGRSTVTNALPHKGAELLLKFDLTDFFPTVHYYRVVGLFASLGYHVGNARFQSDDDGKQVAPTLARLCCYTPDPEAWTGTLMPQGAPTSPALSNLVCRRLDARLTGLAKRNGGVYTRYADDLTFSFKKEPDKLGRFRWWVDQICHQEGFFVNQSKFRVIRRSQRQVVTGIVVNDELRVPREERRRFRAILHNCEKHGVESQARGRAGFADYLRGYASYIHMVHPEEGAELLRRLSDLLGPESPDEEPTP